MFWRIGLRAMLFIFDVNILFAQPAEARKDLLTKVRRNCHIRRTCND
jgi:hypothetical protein